MNFIRVIGFISAFVVFAVNGSDLKYTCNVPLPDFYENGMDGSDYDKRSTEVSKVNENYRVSKTNGYDGNGVVHSEESRESKERELRKPCVHITTNQTACLCSLDGTYTDCSRRGLAFIPIVPLETTSLNMSGNSLQFLDQDSLTNISKSLKSLDVSKNQISNIENGLLSHFTVLKTLNISDNNISYIDIENLTSGISTQLENLMLEGLKLKEFPYGALTHLENTNLATFSVKKNHIKNVSTIEVFQFLKKLKYLDLSFNYIGHIIISHSKTLKSLSLSSNKLSEIPQCCKNGTKLPNLSELFLDDNRISDLQTHHIDCLDKLLLLDISETGIELIPTNAFSGFKSLQIITLEGMKHLKKIDKYAFNSSSLLSLYIHGINNAFIPNDVEIRTILKFCPRLRELDLSNNFDMMFQRTNTDWKYLLQNVSNLEYLDISWNLIRYLPKAIPQYLHNLTILHMDANDIDFIPRDYFIPLTKLRVLTLSHNVLQAITEHDFPPSFTNHLYCINVASNPFVCNCDILWFIEFIKKNRHKVFYDYPSDYDCSNTEDLKSITRFTISKRSCLLRNEITKIIQYTCIVMVSLLIIVSVVHGYRLRLRCMLYVLKINRRKRKNRALTFTHDVYISSADANFNSVYYQLVKELENKGLKVYFPPRDGMPGTFAFGDCLEKIDDSKYVILCISNAYFQDNLCEYEANVALEKSILEQCNSNAIIVVVLEEICSVNVTKFIEKLTRTGDFLIWDDDGAPDNLFWRQLEERMELPVYNV